MSEENLAGTSCCCASCGIVEIDDIKLAPCDGCDLVRYCSDACKRDHKSQHEEACKKRSAELRDALLFKQPESTHLGDCPICSLPLPLDLEKSHINTCCSKIICNGCVLANVKRGEQSSSLSCPFCRKPAPKTEEERDKRTLKRVEANDPDALLQQGGLLHQKGDIKRAFGYWSKAAELGGADAHFRLAVLYREGLGVEKDEEKYIHHAEEAAIGRHPKARYELGCHEWNNNSNFERAVKFWIISASQGEDLSIKALMIKFREGFVEKDDLAASLRAHKAAVDETKSPQREAAENSK